MSGNRSVCECAFSLTRQSTPNAFSFFIRTYIYIYILFMLKYTHACISRLSSLQDKKIGFAMCGSGIAIMFLGITFFFNATLLRLGNILLISGMPIVVGTKRTVRYFTSKQRLRSSLTFLFGFFLVVFAGWPRFGILMEIFGFLNLFGNFFPLFFRLFKGFSKRSEEMKSFL
jgi:hypothetical protein